MLGTATVISSIPMKRARQISRRVKPARRDIAAERDKAVADLRREAVELALGAAAKVVGQRLDADADRKIVLDYLASLEKSH